MRRIVFSVEEAEVMLSVLKTWQAPFDAALTRRKREYPEFNVGRLGGRLRREMKAGRSTKAVRPTRGSGRVALSVKELNNLIEATKLWECPRAYIKSDRRPFDRIPPLDSRELKILGGKIGRAVCTAH